MALLWHVLWFLQVIVFEIASSPRSIKKATELRFWYASIWPLSLKPCLSFEIGIGGRFPGWKYHSRGRLTTSIVERKFNIRFIANHSFVYSNWSLLGYGAHGRAWPCLLGWLATSRTLIGLWTHPLTAIPITVTPPFCIQHMEVRFTLEMPTLAAVETHCFSPICFKDAETNAEHVTCER